MLSKTFDGYFFTTCGKETKKLFRQQKIIIYIKKAIRLSIAKYTSIAILVFFNI